MFNFYYFLSFRQKNTNSYGLIKLCVYFLWYSQYMYVDVYIYIYIYPNTCILNLSSCNFPNYWNFLTFFLLIYLTISVHWFMCLPNPSTKGIMQHKVNIFKRNAFFESELFFSSTSCHTNVKESSLCFCLCSWREDIDSCLFQVYLPEEPHPRFEVNHIFKKL